MKVAELKQVVDDNAAEMREGFADVRTDIANVRTEMRDGFAAVDRRFAAVEQRLANVDERFEAADKRFDSIERRMDDHAAQTQYRIELLLENFADKIALIVESSLDKKIELKIAKMLKR